MITLDDQTSYCIYGLYSGVYTAAMQYSHVRSTFPKRIQKLQYVSKVFMLINPVTFVLAQLKQGVSPFTEVSNVQF